MCGIAGLINFNGQPVDAQLIHAMTASVAHRGPDGEGHYLDGPVGLGHRRLAIIDLSEHGRQPMSNQDKSLWITFNGEIYNFKSIREELEKIGHHFSSASDTEIVLHAYEEWGLDCLSRLNGMFAFGLWDTRRHQLWLVRDRLGVKPLFYSTSPTRLLFGSEIKALLCDDDQGRQPDLRALAYFLALNYTPAPYTLFAGIRQILPGHYLLIEANGEIHDCEYWSLAYKEDTRWNIRDAVNQFDSLLEDAVRLRLVSDVPFGAFLSGGLDSSSVAYWMSRQLREQVKTFTIGFGEPSFDEVRYAEEVSHVLHTNWLSQTVTADISDTLPKLVQHAEEPTADSSMAAVYYLARLARQHVTMVLTGDGADEIIAGYETYQAHYLLKLYRRLPRWLRQSGVAPFVNNLPSSDGKVSLDAKLKRFVANAEQAPEDAHAGWRNIFNARQREELLQPIWNDPQVRSDAVDLYRELFAQTSARHPLNRLLYVDTRFYLPNDMLVKVDRMTMAHGLEARSPFLDYRLVEFAATLPPNLKLHNLWHKKYILKKAMENRLPRRIVWRGKAGFNVPNARWMKGDLKPFVTDILSPQRIRAMGFLAEPVVAQLLKDHFTGVNDCSHQIWGLLTLSIWWHTFVG